MSGAWYALAGFTAGWIVGPICWRLWSGAARRRTENGRFADEVLCRPEWVGRSSRTTVTLHYRNLVGARRAHRAIRDMLASAPTDHPTNRPPDRPIDRPTERSDHD